MKRLPVLVLLLWVCAVFYVGIFLFAGGFLLVRLEVNKSSTCQDVLAPGGGDPDFCRGVPRFRRAVMLVIDALKYDFARYDPLNGNPRPYQNKLPVLHEVTTSQPTHSRLFCVRADPPTTTMQRIKGFTTGSLPTFIDVGNNFASSAILEDNLVHQLGEAGKRVVFMGDDTWQSLFPGKFYRSIPFPSFNVKDLHTVDNGILQHLYTTMKGSNWDVIIAHFLGVDHCGHRFGPDHPAMADKLTQMDEVIRSVLSRLQNDTLLVVMGDHGMTDTGDHGGESQKETDAALFLYSPAPLFFTSQVKADADVVPQTDLVPTLALLLGIPIPYSNIGQVLLPLFPEEAEGQLNQLEALWINAKQVNRFLETYSHMAKDIPTESLALLQANFSRLSAHRSSSGLQAYLWAVRDTCRASWARFHPLKMGAGVLVLALACMLSLALSGDGGLASLKTPLLGGAVLGMCVAVGRLAAQGHTEAVTWGLGVAAISSQVLFLWGLQRHSGTTRGTCGRSHECGGAWRWSWALVSAPAAMLFLRCASLLSDSYVVAEGRVTSFLLLSLTLYVLVHLNWDSVLLPPVRKEMLALLCSLAVLVASVFFSPSFHTCREEQGECRLSPLLSPLSRVRDVRLKNLQYALAVAALVAWTGLLRLWLRHHGNLNSPGPAVFAARWLLPLGSVCTGLYWAVGSAPEDGFRGLGELIRLAGAVLPRAAFSTLGLGVALLWLDPLTVFLQPRRLGPTHSPPNYRASTGVSPQAELRHLIPQLYQRMRRSLEDGESDLGPPGPAVEAYGLGTVYSAPLVLLAGLLGLALLLLHPEGLALAFLVMLLEGAALLRLHAAVVSLSDQQGAQRGGFSVPWTVVLLWDLAATQFFHATGHMPTFPSIQWGAAFVGFPEGHTGTVLPAMLVFFNTFASHILFSVTTPLLLFWPLVCESRVGGRAGRSDGDEAEDAVMEMRLREKPQQFQAALLQLAARYLFTRGAQVLASVCAAAILRRHLMVWKVFAPKLMFEACGFVVSSAFLLVGVALVMRVDVAVSGWFKKLIPEPAR